MSQHNLRTIAVANHAVDGTPVDINCGRGEPEARIGPARGSSPMKAPAASVRSATPPRNCSHPQPLARKFLQCPMHPDEPLQFFCLRCETGCICAECALHGDHRGHDVINIRDAASWLPGKVAEMSRSSLARAEQLTRVSLQSKDAVKDAISAINMTKQELSEAFRRLHDALQNEERAFTSEFRDCNKDVSDYLDEKDDSAAMELNNYVSELEKHHAVRDPIQALTSYAKLRKAMSHSASPSSEANRKLCTEMKSQLQRGFDARKASIAALESQLKQIPPPVNARAFAERIRAAVPPDATLSAEVADAVPKEDCHTVPVPLESVKAHRRSRGALLGSIHEKTADADGRWT